MGKSGLLKVIVRNIREEVCKKGLIDAFRASDRRLKPVPPIPVDLRRYGEPWFIAAAFSFGNDLYGNRRTNPNLLKSTRGRRKAITKPTAASVPFRAADHPRNAKEIDGSIQAMFADGDALAVPIALRTVADALRAVSKNPFLDLSFPPEEAAALHIRSQLAATLELYIQRKGWTQVTAARELKAQQPTVSKIVNGNIEKLSIESLIKLMVRAGLPVGISSGRESSSRSASRRRSAVRPSAAA